MYNSKHQFQNGCQISGFLFRHRPGMHAPHPPPAAATIALEQITATGDKADWLAGAAVLPLGHKAPQPVVRLALLPEQGSQHWYGDHIMDRAPQVQMRPPAALPSQIPNPRPPPTRVPLVNDPSPKSASDAKRIRPTANSIVGNRPLQMLKPQERQPISQQDVFAMMNGTGVLDAAANAKAASAREAAAQRVATRHEATQRGLKEQRAKEARAEVDRYDKERLKLREMFGLSND